jgi:hypothetical protein
MEPNAWIAEPGNQAATTISICEKTSLAITSSAHPAAPRMLATAASSQEDSPDPTSSMKPLLFQSSIINPQSSIFYLFLFISAFSFSLAFP